MNRSHGLTFRTAYAARRFCAGYCVPRVVARVRGGFEVMHPATARRRGLAIVNG